MIRTAVLTAFLAAVAATPCPNRWLANGGFCYLASTYTASWREARTACNAMGAGSDLVSIHSNAENDVVASYLGARGAWIGLNDLDSEGHFVWSDGSQLSYANWQDGQPNNFLDQDCVNIVEDNSGQWDDNHCVEKKDFVCKMPAM
ncbi:lectin BRA-3-like [Pollicipes pollicipes]|uniref:lectin BRA-3-like n=1 Tax=Pollicipes pollicipes TaxID=41117 RepID=UPI001885511C|nr:lectin BRA-3-like [Pollicipes pollicipes]